MSDRRMSVSEKNQGDLVTERRRFRLGMRVGSQSLSYTMS